MKILAELNDRVPLLIKAQKVAVSRQRRPRHFIAYAERFAIAKGIV